MSREIIDRYFSLTFSSPISDIDDGGDVLNNVKENFERNGIVVIYCW